MTKELPIVTTLYCAPTVKGRAPGETSKTDAFQMQLRHLLPLLNFSATCYLINHELPDQNPVFHDTLETISLFIQENALLQMTLRPVHPFNPSDSQTWISAYQKYLQICRPFQEPCKKIRL